MQNSKGFVFFYTPAAVKHDLLYEMLIFDFLLSKTAGVNLILYFDSGS